MKETTTVRIPKDKRDILKIIATIEKRGVQDIIEGLVQDYIERHQETLEILSHPEWPAVLREGKEEVYQAKKGVSLEELDD